VNDTGLVTARGDGRTRITAASENSVASDTATVRVTGAPQQLIAFESPQGIEMIRADGSLRATVIPVTSDYYYTWFPQEPAWSRDGARLAYTVEYTDSYYYGYYNTWSIHTAWADGSAAGPVTLDYVFQGGPTWSPDGTKIAFSRDDGSGWVSLYVMNADGSTVTRLTNPGTANDYEPAWSPDGTKIAFQRNRDGNVEIYVMNADGSDTTRLTDSPGDDLAPSWSPDGSQLAFVSNRGGGSPLHDIWIMNADASGARNLTLSATASDHDPAWSPDGTQIVFDSCPMPSCSVRDLYVVRSDGTGLRRLTTGAAAIHAAWRAPTPLTPPPAAAPAPQARRRSAP
jgi:tol-pal system beta propeller repeat protein TolB